MCVCVCVFVCVCVCIMYLQEVQSVFHFLSRPDGQGRNDGLITFSKLQAVCREFEASATHWATPKFDAMHYGFYAKNHLV